MRNIETDRIFLIVTPDAERREFYSDLIRTHISNSTIYTASDGKEAVFKMRNVPPHVLVTDLRLPAFSGSDLIEETLRDTQLQTTSIILVAPSADQEYFVEQVVTGQLQYLIDPQDQEGFVRGITKALNRQAHLKDAEYFVKFMSAGEILFKQGEPCQSVYIVKSGILRVTREQNGKQVILGEVVAGEFVGEMAHIHQEARSATVASLSDCELIEIPSGTLDLVLFSRPVWAKALVMTLSKRLRRTNDALIEQKESG